MPNTAPPSTFRSATISVLVENEAGVLARVLVGYDRWWPAVQEYDNPFDATAARQVEVRLPSRNICRAPSGA